VGGYSVVFADLGPPVSAAKIPVPDWAVNEELFGESSSV
jgi:hypothetical protein